MNVDCAQSMHMRTDIVSVHHSVTTHSWQDCMLHPSLLALYVVEVYADHPIWCDRIGYPACMLTVSAICPWAKVLVYNNRVYANLTMQSTNIYVSIVGWWSRGHSIRNTGQRLTVVRVCLVERMHSRVSNITHVTFYDNHEHQRSAKAKAAGDAAIHQSNAIVGQSQVPRLSCTHVDPATITDPMLYLRVTKAQRPAGLCMCTRKRRSAIPCSG